VEGIPISSNEKTLDAVCAWGLADGAIESGDHMLLMAGTGLGRGSHDQVVVHRVP
jgi:hypothetical protein